MTDEGNGARIISKKKQLNHNLVTETHNVTGSDIHLNYYGNRDRHPSYSKTIEFKFSRDFSD